MSEPNHEFVAITMPDHEVAKLVRGADQGDGVGQAERNRAGPARWPTEGPCRISPDRPVPYGGDDLHSVLISGPLEDQTRGPHGTRQMVVVTTDPESPDRSFLLDPQTGQTAQMRTHPEGHPVTEQDSRRDRRFAMGLLELLASEEGRLGDLEPDGANSLLNNGEGERAMAGKPPIEVPGPEIFGESMTPLDRIPESAETGRFCPLSLGDWIDACRRANVPHVPAQEAAVLYRHDVIRYEQPGPHQERNDQAVRQARAACRDGEMLRLDCCAGSETKFRLATGRSEWHQSLQNVYVGDPRATELMVDMPRERIPIWRRPWIQARLIGRFPLEYRVYVQEGQVVGVSNYYVQRPLPRNQGHLDAIARWTDALLAVLEPPFLWPYGPYRDYFDDHCAADGVHFTADFIANHNDNVVFLEGNPPHHLGAHPCCFPMDETYGLALAAPEQTMWGQHRHMRRRRTPAYKRRTRWKRAQTT